MLTPAFPLIALPYLPLHSALSTIDIASRADWRVTLLTPAFPLIALPYIPLPAALSTIDIASLEDWHLVRLLHHRWY